MLLLSSLLFVSFTPSNIHPSLLLPGNIHVSFLFFPQFILIPASLCSDKDLLSQTRTLAMSFVKCASTDTEHQYKLVKDISFWRLTCRHTVAYEWINKMDLSKGKVIMFLHIIFTWADTDLCESGMHWFGASVTQDRVVIINSVLGFTETTVPCFMIFNLVLLEIFVLN